MQRIGGNSIDATTVVGVYLESPTRVCVVVPGGNFCTTFDYTDTALNYFNQVAALRSMTTLASGASVVLSEIKAISHSQQESSYVHTSGGRIPLTNPGTNMAEIARVIESVTLLVESTITDLKTLTARVNATVFAIAASTDLDLNPPETTAAGACPAVITEVGWTGGDLELTGVDVNGQTISEVVTPGIFPGARSVNSFLKYNRIRNLGSTTTGALTVAGSKIIEVPGSGDLELLAVWFEGLVLSEDLGGVNGYQVDGRRITFGSSINFLGSASVWYK